MAFYTLKSNRVICPFWNTEVVITATYWFIDPNGSNPYLARFGSASCEILENIRLPESKKDKRLGLFPFCRVDHCDCLYDFPNEIDVRHP